jgi:alkyl sulfatase BDS1-like metallo-beta-lactamase superfamily hydrolase
MKRIVILLAYVVVILLGAACTHRQAEEGGSLGGLSALPTLKAHTEIFRKGVEKIGDNVYAAIGYGLANSIMIEGEDGLIIVDTMESCEAASEVLSEFRKISDKPVRAIIYTHNHVDHIFGAEVFAHEGGVPVYAHETTAGLVGRIVSKMRTVTDMRGMRMFGSFLDGEGLVNCGIGPFLRYDRNSTIGYLPPTRTFSDTLTDMVAGIEFELVHAPGETDDQIFVWLPRERVLLCGDNFYWAFPNLYTIRGTPYRSLQQWYRSIDRIRDRRPEYLVPSHSRPVIGQERIETVLRDYRDAIQFVHDQAIRGINQGMTPDELAEHITLPPHLAEAPYLQPFYGKVSWSVRSVFAGELGWFDGDASNINPLNRTGRARLMVRLAGSEEALQGHAQQALDNGEYQTALEISGHLIRLNPENHEARDIRVRSLFALGEREENPNARHYYLTEALEIRDGFVALADAGQKPEQVRRFPLEGFFELLAVNLDPVASASVDQRVGMRFDDEKTAYIIHVRRGVAEIRTCEPGDLDGMDLDIEVTADAGAFKEMLARIRNPVIALAGFDYEQGNAIQFARFLRMFSLKKPKLPYEPLEQ